MSELRMLGLIDVVDKGLAVDLGPRQRRLVLGALAVDAGEAVAVDTVVGRVWDEPPDGALRVVYAHVARLRQALESVEYNGSPVRLDRRSGGGYVLDVDRSWVDVHRFQSLAEQGNDGQLDAGERAGLLRTALDQWRGAPLAGANNGWAVRFRERLSQQRVAALVRWGELELSRGNAAVVIDLAQVELIEYPQVEPLTGLLMRALAADGRGSEALRLYAAVRRQFLDEHGVEPGEALRQLHQTLLHGEDAAMKARPHVVPEHLEGGLRKAVIATPRPAAAPAQLPPAARGFTGRTAELSVLNRMLTGRGDEQAPIVAITGIGGIGKTALAVHWAAKARSYFPHGQLYVDLRGFDHDAPRRPIEVLGSLLRSLGVPAELVPTDLDEASARFRSAVAGRRTLLILDNAYDASQVRPLLPGSDAMVLITSRNRLSDLVIEHGVGRITLDVLASKDAVALLASMLGDQRVASQLRSATELAGLCGHLPLALRIAAANILNRPRASLSVWVDELRTGEGLAAFSSVANGLNTLRRTFDLSYRGLDESAQRCFGCLGIVPAIDVSVACVAAMLDTDIRTARSLLHRLAAEHLVEEPRLDRFALRDLVRAYARERARDDAAANDEAAPNRILSRLFDWYLAGLHGVRLRLYPQMAGPAPGVVADVGGDRETAVGDGAHTPGDNGAQTVGVADLWPGVAQTPADAPAPDGPCQARDWINTEAPNILAAIDFCAKHGLYGPGLRLGYAMRGYASLSRDIPAREASTSRSDTASTTAC